MNVSLTLNEEDTNLINNYLATHGISIAELFRNAVIERIEDELDLQDYEQAMEEYKKNPNTCTLDEIERELGL